MRHNDDIDRVSCMYLRVTYVKDRHLTPQQHSHLLTAMQSGAKGEFVSVAILSAPDAAEFATELENVLVEAGWTPRTATVGVMSFRGFLIRVRNPEKIPQRARDLLRALQAVGLATEFKFVSDLPDDDEVIFDCGQ